MKTKKLNLAKMLVFTVGISGLTTLTAFAGPPVVIVTAPAPAVSVVAPAPVVVAPAVTVVTTVPDTYYWDGYENVGIIGDQYYYLGTGNIWLAMDAPHLAHFHAWQTAHLDWRTHSVRNDLYRHDAHGHVVPFHDNHARPMQGGPGHDQGHDQNDGHDRH
jgi:hypothetical protein